MSSYEEKWSKMPLSFKGVAHNIPGEKRKNRHDLSNAEISTASLGASGTPILVEHAGEPVGSVTSDWVSPNGALRVSGVINDPKAEALVRSGKMRELSLGQSLHTDGAGHPLWRSTDELSICSKAARPGCGINEIDGKQQRHQPAKAMAEAESAPPAAPAEFTQDYVDSLKAELAAKSASEAALKSKFAGYESKQRKLLAELQPSVEAWVQEGLEAADAEVRLDIEPMAAFSANLANAESIDSVMPLARLIGVHSSKLTRERAEFSASKTASEELSSANKQIDELTADAKAKAQRIEELEGLVKERTAAAETLQGKLADAGLVRDRLDFSLAANREVNPPAEMSEKAAGKQPLSASSYTDPLMSFLTSNRGLSSGRINQSSTGHSLLGSSAGGEQGIEAALRAFV